MVVETFQGGISLNLGGGFLIPCYSRWQFAQCPPYNLEIFPFPYQELFSSHLCYPTPSDIGKIYFDPCFKSYIYSICRPVLLQYVYYMYINSVYWTFWSSNHLWELAPLGLPLLRHRTARSCGRWRPGEVCVWGGSLTVRRSPSSSLGRTQIKGLLVAGYGWRGLPSWWPSLSPRLQASPLLHTAVAPVSEKEFYGEYSLFIISYK